jgi:hypothetical protein
VRTRQPSSEKNPKCCHTHTGPKLEVHPAELEAVLAELEAQQRDALAQLVADNEVAWAAWLGNFHRFN